MDADHVDTTEVCPPSVHDISHVSAGTYRRDLWRANWDKVCVSRKKN